MFTSVYTLPAWALLWEHGYIFSGLFIEPTRVEVLVFGRAALEPCDVVAHTTHTQEVAIDWFSVMKSSEFEFRMTVWLTTGHDSGIVLAWEQWWW